ncbi:MAG: hypothetical protein Kow0059_19530 [Candidatus Sumerlaeia bacterium]
MLTWLRKKQKPILKWTLILVIPSFIAFYGWSTITGANRSPDNPDSWWIRIKDEKAGGGWQEITQWDMRQARESLMDRYIGLLQNAGFGAQAAQLVRQFESAITNERLAMEAIDNAILRMYARERGLTVSADELQSYVTQAYRGLNSEQARRFLQSQGLTEQAFLAQARQRLLLEKARREVAAPAFVSVYETWQEYALSEQGLKVAALELNQADFINDVVVEEAALQDYFTKNIETYRIPEKRTYEYIKIDRLAMREELQPDQAAIAAYYEAHKEEFMIEPGVKVRQILLRLPPDASDEQKQARQDEARRLLERLQAGEDFAALADEVSEDPANVTSASAGSTETIKLGGLIDAWITPSTTRYGEEFVKAAMALNPGKLSDVISTPRGLVILKCVEAREGRTPPFEEVREQAEEKWREARSRELFKEQRTRLAEAISNYTDFTEIAQAAGLRVQTTEPLNADNYFFPNIGNLSSYEIYFKDMENGDSVPGVMDIPNADNPNVAVYMRLVKIEPTHLPELSEVRDRVEGDFKREKALELARQRAESLKTAVKTLEDLKQAASDLGKQLKTTDDFVKLQDIESAGLPRIRDFASELVRTPELTIRLSEVRGFLRDSIGGYALWMITERQPLDKAEFQKRLDELQAGQLHLKRQTFLAEFLAARRNRLKIEYNSSIFPDLAANQ